MTQGAFAGWFSKLPIKQKLVLLIMTISLSAMLTVSCAFFIYERFVLRQRMAANLSAQAEMLTSNCEAALSFNDPGDAEKILSSLKAINSIAFACVYQSNGKVLASYQRSGFEIGNIPEPQPDGYIFNKGRLIIFRQVSLGNRAIGTVYLQSDLREISKLMRQSLITLVTVLLLSALFAYFLATRFHRVVSTPIFHLAETATTISQHRDYSVRALKHGEDELGVLTDAFNEMLAEIEMRDLSLKESEERLQSIIDNSTAVIYLKDTHGKYLLVNKQYETLFHITQANVVGKTDYDIFPKEAAEAFSGNDRKALELDSSLEIEERVPQDDGIHIYLSNKFPLHNASGIPYGVCGVSTDITERKRTQEELSRHRDHLEEQVQERTADLDNSVSLLSATIESTADGILVVDMDANITAHNNKFTELWNIPEPIIESKDNKKLLGYVLDQLADPQSFLANLEALYKQPEKEDLSVIKLKDGRIFERYSLPQRLRDHVIGRVWNFRDVTDRERTEEERQRAKEAAEAASRAKSEFLASMSHELRTPLNAILGFSGILDRDPDTTTTQKEHLTTITRSGEHLLDLINDVLEISKIESGRVVLVETEFDLYQMLDALRSMFRIRASDKNLGLHFEQGPEVPQYIRADARRLRQVLINLLSNAVKFTEQGSVTLRVGYQSSVIRDQGGNETETEGPDDRRQTTVGSKHHQQIKDDGRRALLFEIEDTGTGIAPEEMDKLFDPFSQTKSGKIAQEGTGLGLPISQNFLHLMGGEFSVSSKESQGSIFAFKIPVTEIEAKDVQQASPERRVVGLEPAQRAFRILVVDDVEDNRTLAVNLLDAVGFETSEAKNGQEAVDVWEAWAPHLIWMDMAMPVMDGYEATRRIRAEETKPSASSLDSEEGLSEDQFKIKHSTLKIKRVPIIALTAVAFAEEQDKMLVAGCDDIVRKPLRESDLFEAMHKYLGVHYIYEDEPVGGELPEEKMTAKILTPDILNNIPKDMLAEFEEALIELNADLIQAIIERLRKLNNSVANCLRKLADNFQYDQILTYIQRAIDERKGHRNSKESDSH